MLSNSFNILFILFIAATAGILFLIYSFLKLQRKVNMLLGESGAERGGDTYEVIQRLVQNEQSLADIEPRLHDISSASRISIQKVGFLRFNPFDGIGGDNSFVLALLDRENNGVLISSLYMRDGMRMYGKKVENGKTPYPLLAEEKQVLEDAVQK